MLKTISRFFLLAVVVFIGCSRKSENKTLHAFIDARFTVADSIDATGDFSGIQLLIISEIPDSDAVDTLYAGKTDINGFLIGTARFEHQGLYPAFISRNGVNLLYSQVILADADTIRISGELPGISGNFKVDSREERAAKSYSRVESGFNRTLNFIRAGLVEDSLVAGEIFKWSDLFWQIYKEYPGTLASNLGAQRSVQVLNGFDDELLQKRLKESLGGNDAMINFAADFGTDFTAQRRGLEASVKYLDSLKNLTKRTDIIQNLEKEVIRIYYDSSKTTQAKQRLEKFAAAYKKDKKAMEWVERTSFDLDYLAFGNPAPDFSFVTLEGDTVSNVSLAGTPYVLEITPVTSQLYKDQFDRSLVIKQIYAAYGLEFYTIPLEKSEITVRAFFDDRENPWQAALPGSFEVGEILKTFNVSEVPVRLLVDEHGNIQRKYVAEEFEDVISGLNKMFSQKNQES